MAINKISNEYVGMIDGAFYAATPKAVFAALALSLAMRLSEENPYESLALLRREWATLHANGIVPQQPRP